MSYFSKATLHPRGLSRVDLRDALGSDSYLDHRLVWKLFPSDAMQRDFIFHKARDPVGQVSYYIVSQRCPQAVAGLLSVRSKPYRPELQTGEILRFDLRANPTISISREGSKRGIRHDVLMHAKHQLQGQPFAAMQAAIDQAAADWLVDRAEKWGLTVMADSLRIDSYTQHRFLYESRRIGFSSVDYSGAARVVDPDRLYKALTDGVGHAKAFGCGLLMVRRIS